MKDLFLFTFDSNPDLETWRKDNSFRLAKYSITRKEYSFPSGVVFMLRVINSPDDVDRLAGLQFTGLFLHQNIDIELATRLQLQERA